MAETRGPMSATGQQRRISRARNISASPPTSDMTADINLRRSGPEAVGYTQNKTHFCDRYHARLLVVNASSGYRQRAEWPAQEHVMRNRWIGPICAGGGALIGVAVGDWFNVSLIVGMLLTGACAGIGALIGSALAAAKASGG